MRMSPQKRNALRRLRKAVSPILYPTGIVDDSEPDGSMRLYMFQHTSKPGDRDREMTRPIDDDYTAGRWAGTAIEEFWGFAADAIVDDVCIAITLYPYRLLSLPTLRRLLRMVERIDADRKAAEAAGRPWPCSRSRTRPPAK